MHRWFTPRFSSEITATKLFLFPSLPWVKSRYVTLSYGWSLCSTRAVLFSTVLVHCMPRVFFPSVLVLSRDILEIGPVAPTSHGQTRKSRLSRYPKILFLRCLLDEVTWRPELRSSRPSSESSIRTVSWDKSRRSHRVLHKFHRNNQRFRVAIFLKDKMTVENNRTTVILRGQFVHIKKKKN